MNKLAKMITRLKREELLLLQKDLDSGNIEKAISMQLQNLGGTRQRTCPACGTNVEETSGLRLEFGPPDLRQQAFFDGTDCIQFFIKEHFRK
jgi:hypothetical protein